MLKRAYVLIVNILFCFVYFEILSVLLFPLYKTVPVLDVCNKLSLSFLQDTVMSTVLISRTRAGLSGKMDSRVDGDILLSKLAIWFIVAIIIFFLFIHLLNNFLVS